MDYSETWISEDGKGSMAPLMSDAEFSRVMDEYWNSLEGIDHGRRVNFYVTRQEKLRAERDALRRQARQGRGFVA